MNRRSVIKGMLAAGAFPFFNIGCTGFGRGRAAQLAAGSTIRIAVIGCGSWGRTLLNRASLHLQRADAGQAVADLTKAVDLLQDADAPERRARGPFRGR